MRRSVLGYEDKFEVSSKGEIFFIGTDHKKATRDDGRGYLTSTFSRNGIKKTIKAHKVVATAFIANPCGKPEINHIDGNKYNNSIDNLEWCTHLENARHAMKHGLLSKHCGGYIGKGIEKISVLRINTLREAELMGFDGSTISKCCKGSRNYHKGYTWSHIS